MRNYGRLGLVLGLAISVSQSAAHAQVGGTSSGAQASGATVNPAPAGDTNGGLYDPTQGDNALTNPSTTTVAPPRPSRVYSFNRVTTGGSAVVSVPSPARRAAAPGGTSAAAIGSSRARAMQAQAKGAKDRIPASSSWNEGAQRPTSPPPATVRSTTHNYYPGMRPGLAPNVNTPQAARSGQSRTGMMAGGLLGLGANTAKVARPAPTVRLAPSAAAAAPRR
jgi:hypothetical protein